MTRSSVSCPAKRTPPRWCGLTRSLRSSTPRFMPSWNGTILFGAVKDRVAANLVRDAEEHGVLVPGKKLVEATSGNTGLGLAMIGNAKGLHPQKPRSPPRFPLEKRTILRFFGTKVVELDDLALPGARARRKAPSPYRARDSRQTRLHFARSIFERSEPRRPLPHDRPGNLAADAGQGHPLHRRPGHLRRNHGNRPVPEGKATAPVKSPARRLSGVTATTSRACAAAVSSARAMSLSTEGVRRRSRGGRQARRSPAALCLPA